MRMVSLDPQEVLALLRAAKAHSPRAHAMVLLAFKHGMRVSELTALRLEDVNLREGWIRVARLKGSMLTVQPLHPHPGEPLLDEPRALKAYLKGRREDGSGAFFISSHGGRLNRSSVFRLWRTLTERAGLPPEKRCPRTGKHTLGSTLARQNVGAFLIKQALGHRSITSSMAYCRVSDAEAGRAVRAALISAF
jgi:type 1 fimbriae regulatory protein FimB